MAKGIKLEVNSNIHVPAVICMLITVERYRFRFESSDSDAWITSLLSDLKMKVVGLLTIFQLYNKENEDPVFKIQFSNLLLPITINEGVNIDETFWDVRSNYCSHKCYNSSDN